MSHWRTLWRMGGNVGVTLYSRFRDAEQIFYLDAAGEPRSRRVGTRARLLIAYARARRRRGMPRRVHRNARSIARRRRPAPGRDRRRRHPERPARVEGLNRSRPRERRDLEAARALV